MSTRFDPKASTAVANTLTWHPLVQQLPTRTSHIRGKSLPWRHYYLNLDETSFDEAKQRQSMGSGLHSKRLTEPGIFDQSWLLRHEATSCFWPDCDWPVDISSINLELPGKPQENTLGCEWYPISTLPSAPLRTADGRHGDLAIISTLSFGSNSFWFWYKKQTHCLQSLLSQ